MADTLANVRIAVEQGRAALRHQPPRIVTITPTIADLNLPQDVTDALLANAGPIPTPILFSGGAVTTASGYKTTIRFGGLDGNTWSETYQVPAADPYTAATKMRGILGLRAAFLAVGFAMDYIRASDVTRLRASITLSCNEPGILAGTTSLALGGAALDYQVFIGNGKAVIRTFRGLPQQVVNRSLTTGFALPPTCDSQVKAWIAGLISIGAGIFPITPVTKGVPVDQWSYNPIVSVNGAPFPGFALVTTQNAYTLSSSQQVQISLADGKLYPGLNGIWTADPVTDHTFYIPYQVANNSNLARATGRVRMYQLQALAGFSASPPPAFYDNNYHKTRSFDTRGRAARRAKGLRTLA